VAVFTSHPSAGLPLQSANPIAHAPIAHVDPVHSVAALGNALHGMLQPPQFWMSPFIVSWQLVPQHVWPAPTHACDAEQPGAHVPPGAQMLPAGHSGSVVHCLHECDD
jgi:hypothetical protein